MNIFKTEGINVLLLIFNCRRDCRLLSYKGKIHKMILGEINVVMLMGAIQFDGLTPFIKWVTFCWSCVPS